MKPFLVDDSPSRAGIGVSRRFQEPSCDTFAVDGLRIHFPSQTVHVDGQLVTLTNTEYRLLCQLVRNAGRVLGYQALLQQASRSDCSTTDVVRFQVSRLRAKLEAGWVTPRYIFTSPGVGYWFQGPADGPGCGPIDDRSVVGFPTPELDPLGHPWQRLVAQQPIWLGAA